MRSYRKTAASDFDDLVDRTETDSVKWDRYVGTDIIPMWLADMDFKTPAPILNAIRLNASESAIGYGSVPAELVEIIRARLQRLYNWNVEARDIYFVPQVVPALNMACRAFVGSGEAVLTTIPNYPPMLQVAGNWQRELHKIPISPVRGEWLYPLDLLATALEANPQIKLLLLCNPYNPIGRVLNEEELSGIVALCAAYDVVICSDEIHSEILYDARTHLPTAMANAAAKDITITLLAPSKTFNMAGVVGAFAVIQNEVLRDRYIAAGKGIMPEISSLSFSGMHAAYRDCDDWKNNLIEYLEGNKDYMLARIDKIPGLEMNRVEATYLAWLDVSELELDDDVGFFESAGVGLSAGIDFDGPGYLRLNFACPRETLRHACDRIERAVLQSCSNN